MSAESNKAGQIRAPNDDTTADNHGSVYFTCGNSILRNALPQGWNGRRFIIVRNVGSVAAWWTTSTRVDTSGAATSTIVTNPTAADAGTTSQVGAYIGAGEIQRRELPGWESKADRERRFFIRISHNTGGVTTLLVEAGDGT